MPCGPAAALARNLANFMPTLALPQEVEHWSVTTLREKPVRIGARIVRNCRYVPSQLAEVACRAGFSSTSCAGLVGSEHSRRHSGRMESDE
jgi:hypothetical protein